MPFFQMSASEFVEMIVGVGASRVRDLFHQAKEAAPAIIFIDELDAIGRSRSARRSNLSGGHDEREQTLNQILTEMDGFSPARERDRAGRDQPARRSSTRRCCARAASTAASSSSPPDRAGREAILRVHTRSVPLDADVDLGAIAASTPGMVGADLANVANEAALLAAKRGHAKVARQDFTDALERIVLGAARKVMISEDDRRRTAYHEAGHAIIGMLTPGADPVRKVSIIPRGMALGVTFSAPDADRFNFDERHLLAQIKVALGGRVGRGGRVRRPDHRRRVRHPAADPDRPRHGRALGHEPRRSARSRCIPADGQGPLLPGRQRDLGARPSGWSTRRCAGSSRPPTRRRPRCSRSHRANLDSLVAALLEHETLDEADAYAAAGLARNAGPSPRKRRPSSSSRRSTVGRRRYSGGGPRSRPRARARSRSSPRRRAASTGRPHLGRPRAASAPHSRRPRSAAGREVDQPRSKSRSTMSTASSSPTARLSSTSERATSRPGYAPPTSSSQRRDRLTSPGPEGDQPGLGVAHPAHPLGHPPADRHRLLERVVALVAHLSNGTSRPAGQSLRRVIRASASWHSTTRCLTGSLSGRSWTRSQVRSAISRAFSGVALSHSRSTSFSSKLWI